MTSMRKYHSTSSILSNTILFSNGNKVNILDFTNIILFLTSSSLIFEMSRKYISTLKKLYCSKCYLILYFLTLNINTYDDIIYAKHFSLFLRWTYVMCFTMNHYQFQSAKNVIPQWTLVVK
jgi:hypothetical protein